MSKVSQMKRSIQKDINDIDEALSSKDCDKMLKIHKHIDSKYQTSIENWGLSMYGWNDGAGFKYDSIGKSSITDNLETMKGKLENYKQNVDIKLYETFSKPTTSINVINSNVNKNTNKNINTIDFKMIEETILNNESMTESQTKEALEYLNELRKIYDSNDTKKNKWEKAKKIVSWLIDKGVDVAIAFLPTIVSMIG